MAWTLLEWVAEATTVWFVASFLKRTTGVLMSEVCMIPTCQRAAAVGMRGLCLVCHSKAKKKVIAGETTWEKLVKMKLCKEETDPFDDAYAQAMEDNDY